MNYFVQRADTEYGPYTLADLQHYVASGEILPTDMVRSDGMEAPMDVADVIGTIPIATPTISPVPVLVGSQYPSPPDLHWALVLVFTWLTCGIFGLVWDIIQATWMKKVAPQSQALYYYVGGAGALALVFLSSLFAGIEHRPASWAGLLNLAYVVLLLIARFSLRNSLEQHFNTAEPSGLSLSGVMTFFFGCIYFQYHLSEIAKAKRLTPAVGYGS